MDREEILREALRLKGNILEMLGVPIEARWCYEAIWEIKPDDVRTLIDIGDTYNFSEDSDDFDTALTFYNRAIDVLNKGHFSESLEEELEDAYFCKVTGLRDAGREEQARACLEAARQRFPTSERFQDFPLQLPSVQEDNADENYDSRKRLTIGRRRSLPPRTGLSRCPAEPPLPSPAAP